MSDQLEENKQIDRNTENEIPKRKLTLKERKWLKIYLQTGNATEAAAQVYDVKDRNSANAIGSENLAKLSNLELDNLMDEMGLDDISLVQVLINNLKATRLYGKNAIEHADSNARNKALELALKIKGKLVDKVDLGNGLFTATKLIIEEVKPKEQLTEVTEPKDDTKSETGPETEADPQPSGGPDIS